MPDWNQLFPASKEKGRSERELEKFQRGYLAYLEANKGNPQLSRWNHIVNSLETALLNEGKSLDVVVTESLNMPISKKETKQGLKDEEWRYRADLALDGKAQKWMNHYFQEHQEEIVSLQERWRQEGYVGSEIAKMTKEYLEEQFDVFTKKKWNLHLKNLKEQGVQRSDLGKFRVLVDTIQSKPESEQLRILITDTNFDGVRNYLDGRGTKRGSQVDAAFHTVLEQGKPLEEIVKNIGEAVKMRNATLQVPTESVNAFTNWLKLDIRNARMVQSVLMDSPAEVMDIMAYGKNALKKTLEKNNFSPEELQKIQNKIDTDPVTKDFSAAQKAEIMSSLSSYLLTKMQEVSPNAKVNGLGVGINVPLADILDGLSFTIGTGVNVDGGRFAGVGLAWNTKVATWETGTFDVGVKAGTVLGVIPLYGFSAGGNQELNTKELLGNLDPTALNAVSFGVNVTMIGTVPSW